MNSTIKIVFMGTPKFAVASLQEIIKAKYIIAGVVTPPDKPSGRGLKLHMSDVKQFANEHHLPLFQPKNLKSKSFIREIEKISPDIIVVVAFKKLPKELWSIPKKGTFNLHASLLPQYRGAAPINWAIINGEERTGVTTFLIDETIDTGKILLKKEIPIERNANAGKIHDILMDIGSHLVVETIDKLMSESITPQPQSEKQKKLKEAPKLYPATCEINWNLPLPQIHNFIRGLSPYPGAWSYFTINNQKKKVKILKGHYELSNKTIEQVKIEIKDTELIIIKPDGIFKIEELQIEGKSKMLVKSFVNGCKSIFI